MSQDAPKRRASFRKLPNLPTGGRFNLCKRLSMRLEGEHDENLNHGVSDIERLVSLIGRTRTRNREESTCSAL